MEKERNAGAEAGLRLLTETLAEAGIFAAAELRGGRIVLSGEVESQEDRQAALDVAGAVAQRLGVEVEDSMEVLDFSPEDAFGGDDATGTVTDLRPDVRTPEVSMEALRPDFQGDAGTDDAMVAAAEAIPYMPPTDPVVRPIDGPEELAIVGGFAETSMDDDLGDLDVNARRPDEDILDDVVRELREDASTIDLAIRVIVGNGIVTLHGEVPTLEDAENAEAVAGRIPGIVEVREELRIAGMERRPS